MAQPTNCEDAHRRYQERKGNPKRFAFWAYQGRPPTHRMPRTRRSLWGEGYFLRIGVPNTTLSPGATHAAKKGPREYVRHGTGQSHIGRKSLYPHWETSPPSRGACNIFLHEPKFATCSALACLEVARASSPCPVTAKMAVPLQTHHYRATIGVDRCGAGVPTRADGQTAPLPGNNSS